MSHDTVSRNCPLLTGLRPCPCDLPRCAACGYTKHDAAFEMDHHLCRGVIPVVTATAARDDGCVT